MIGSLFLNKTYSRSELKGLLEGILFVSGKSVSWDELKRVFEMNETEMQALIDETNADYEERLNGFKIIPVAGGFQLVTSPRYKEELAEIFGKRNENKLPKSSLEVLAIIAYKQPVTKEEIDKIRGVSCTRSINTLLALKLVTISGSSDNIIKSPLYVTTERFLEFFRITSLEDLPPISTIDINTLSIEDDEETDEGGEDEEPKDETIFG